MWRRLLDISIIRRRFITRRSYGKKWIESTLRYCLFPSTLLHNSFDYRAFWLKYLALFLKSIYHGACSCSFYKIDNRVSTVFPVVSWYISSSICIILVILLPAGCLPLTIHPSPSSRLPPSGCLIRPVPMLDSSVNVEEFISIVMTGSYSDACCR